MANIVEIVIKGADQSAKPIMDASNNLKNLGKTAATQAQNLRMSFHAIGQVAQRFGGEQIAGAVVQIEGLGIAAQGAAQAFTRFGAARVAAYGVLAAAAVAGVATIQNQIEKQELLATAQAAGVAIQDDLSISLLKYKSATDAAFQSEQSRYRLQQQRIIELEKEGVEVEQLNRLNEEANRLAKEKILADAERKVDAAWSDMFGMQGKLIKSSSFGTGGGRGYETFTPEQAAEVLSTRRKYDAMLESFKQYTSEKDEVDAYSKAIEAQREKSIHDMVLRFEREKLQARLRTFSNYAGQVGSIFGSLATIMEQQGKKSFAFTQALRYAEAVVNTAAGVARAFAEYTWPYSVVVAAAVAAAGAAQIAVIANQKPPQAHGGLSYVPEEATYKLSKGERVLAPRQNRDLTDALQGGGMGGGDIHIDGVKLGQVLHNMSRNGTLKIARRAIV